ncbi:MAG: tetratricopeptide repeat protein [Luteolibacter sp.]|uniref:tetratricopeptide repeat protein n=1 Tax=Luteolibacter sp. TaxID=1962973 RepID=UPI0032659671
MRRWIPFTLVPLLACGPTFYQAPPPLEHYSQRLATKRWSDLFKESSPPDPMAPKETELSELCHRLPEELKGLTAEARLKRIDALISSNQAGEYSSATANFLHEIRELAATDATFSTCGGYLAWRVEHGKDALPRGGKLRPWNMSEEEFAAAREEAERTAAQKKEEFAALVAGAPPALAPYWKVQAAAFLFRSGFYQEAGGIFAEVADHQAGHPRAEVAALMLARCRLDEARQIPPPDERNYDAATAEKRHELLGQANELLEKFISRYPNGRFTPDAHGWLGAVAIENGQLGLAVRHQLDRLDLQPTREITKTVLRECDFIFDKLFERQDGGDFENGLDGNRDFDAVAVASHPLVARLFIQHALDPAAAEMLAHNWQENSSSDRWTIQFLNQRIVRQQEFVEPALLKLGEEMLKRSSPTDEATLTILAWSATEAGEHGQALALISKIRSDDPRDEALHAKAIILQRLGRHGEAVAAFDALEKAYPQSPLVIDLPQRRAMSLFYSGHAGEAFVAFGASDGDEGEGGPKLNPEFYEVQWADTLLQFAPLDQLATAVDGLADDSKEAPLLRQAIRTRALAMHDFSRARKYLSKEEAPAADEPEYSKIKAGHLDEAEWQSRIAPLESLYGKLADPAAVAGKAKTELEIARYWWEHRGLITMPGLYVISYANSEGEKQELLRRQNGLQLGFSREFIDTELDARDEATHALAHAMEAAKSDDPAVAIPALELANECLFHRAEFSAYQRGRALETDAAKLSMEIHDRLKRLGVKNPVYLVFPPAVGPWMPGDYNSWNAADKILDALSGTKSKLWEDEDDKSSEIKKACFAVATRFEHPDSTKSLPQLRHQVEDAKRELNGLRATLDPAYHVDILSVVDRLDDLMAAASLPGITAADFANYAAGVRDKLPPAFKSFLDFRKRLAFVNDSNSDTEISRNDTPEGWAEFLATYPDSPKAEAASLRYVRLIARQHRGRPSVEVERFPEASVPDGYKRVWIEEAERESDPAMILSLIAAHEKRFPKGRYRQDLNLLKAAALIDKVDLPEATKCLLEILGDPVQGDLHQIAALNFCEISQRLLVPAERQAVVEAFRKNPVALPKLRLLVNGDTYLSRLHPLMPWLETP